MGRDTFFASLRLGLPFLICSTLLTAQEQEWKTFNTSNSGLASNDVRAIAVDGDFIWFGTYGSGVSRYQKSVQAWTTFNTSNTNIVDDFIQVVAVDGNHVWIGTDVGISRYDKLTTNWTNWQSLSCISDIGVDWDDIWFSTAGSGVYRYEKASGNWTVFDSTNSGLISNTVTGVAIGGDWVWFGTKSGVCRYNQSTGTWQSFKASSDGLAGNEISALEIDGDDVWFGHAPASRSLSANTKFPSQSDTKTASAICPQKWLLTDVTIRPAIGFHPSASRFRQSLDQWDAFEFCRIDTLRNEKKCYPVYTIAASAEDVWLAAARTGVHRYHKPTETWTNFDGTNSGLVGDWVWTIAIDGNYVWIGTLGHGVSRYRASPALWKCYRKSDGLVDESVRAIGVLGDEAWFGTHRGISRLQISTEKWTTFFDSSMPNILNWAVGVDTHYVWVGPTLGRHEKSTNTWMKIDTSVSQLGKSAVYSIAVDGDKIWFGASEGKISLYHKPTNTWTLFDSTVTKFRAAVWDVDPPGDELWFGGLGGGAGYYNQTTNTWVRFDTSNSALAHNNVTSVATDGDYVWFGTFGGGISRYHKPTNSWVTFNQANTGILFLDLIWAVAVDGDFVWFGSHSRGVYRYEKSTGLWENFNHLNSPLPARRVYDIEADGRYVWISVFDTDPNNSSIRTGGVCRYGDVNPPELLHSPVSIEQPSAQPILILASIDDNVGVKSAAVQYRLLGTTDYKLTPLQRLSGDTWFGQIPGSDVAPGVMEYYLTATDGRNTASHPYSSAPNAPHRFTVYDAVPPIAVPFIRSPNPNNTVSDFTVINATIRLDGTGSFPSLLGVELIQYWDLAARIALDSMVVTLMEARQDTNGNAINITGKIDVGDLREDAKAIRLRITATDLGHDSRGNPLIVTDVSDPLFTPIPSPALAQVIAPDSGKIVAGVVTIKGTASHPNLRQFILSFHDSQGRSGIIASGTESRIDAILGPWDTTILPDGSYELRLRVESNDGASTTIVVPVVVDNTRPTASIDNLSDNEIIGGTVVIIGTAWDAHFATYELEFGEGVNPVTWSPLAKSIMPVALQDTLALWNTAGLNGPYSLRLRVTDQAGLETSVARFLTLDNTAVQVRISSPANGAVVTDSVKIRGTVIDANLKEYVVEYAAASAPQNRMKIHSASTQVSNGDLADWDTQGLNGNFIIRLTATDKTNAAIFDSVSVVVDNIDPVVELTWPRDGYQIGGVIAIRGTATDANFDKFTLELGEGADPQIWTSLTSTVFREPVVNHVLYTWPVDAELGEYTLRLIAHDKVGHQNETRAFVNVIGQILSHRGGCTQSQDGKVELCVPPNAISENTAILINSVPPEEIDSNAPIDLVGSVYEIAPTNVELLKTGTLRMIYSPEIVNTDAEQRKLAIASRTESNNAWRLLGGTVDPGRSSIVAAVNELGWFALTLDENLSAENLTPGIEVQPRVFSPITGRFDYKASIMMTVEKPGNATIKVYHPNGRLKAVLRDHAPINRGANAVEWNGRDTEGNVVPSGLYILFIEVDGKVTKKTVMVLNN